MATTIRDNNPFGSSFGGGSGAAAGMSIGGYLIRRLQDYGIGEVFGIPGDYILTRYGQLESSPIRVVGCTREDSAGFAAEPTLASTAWELCVLPTV